MHSAVAVGRVTFVVAVGESERETEHEFKWLAAAADHMTENDQLITGTEITEQKPVKRFQCHLIYTL